MYLLLFQKSKHAAILCDNIVFSMHYHLVFRLPIKKYCSYPMLINSWVIFKWSLETNTKTTCNISMWVVILATFVMCSWKWWRQRKMKLKSRPKLQSKITCKVNQIAIFSDVSFVAWTCILWTFIKKKKKIWWSLGGLGSAYAFKKSCCLYYMCAQEPGDDFSSVIGVQIDTTFNKQYK